MAFHISDNARILRTTRNHSGARPKQPGTIVILTKYLDTPTKIPTIHLRTSTVGFHMAPVTWSHRDPTIGLHSTNNIIRFFHDLHHRESQDPKPKTPQDYPSITHDTNHITSKDPYHRTPHGYYHVTSQDSHHETSQYPPNTLFHRIVTTRPLRVLPTDSCRKHRTKH